MRRIPMASLIVLAGFVRAAEIASSAPPAVPPATPIETSQAVTTNNAEKRAVSPLTAAKLAAAAPKFEDVPPVEVGPIVPAESPVGRPSAPAGEPANGLLEQARNQIIRMPDFIVGEPAVHVPNPLQVLTAKGRAELAFQRWPGLRVVPLGFMNANVALEMLEDDLLAQRRRAAAELYSLYLVW